MMRLLLAAALAMTAGCGTDKTAPGQSRAKPAVPADVSAKPTPAPPHKDPPMNDAPVTLNWRMSLPSADLLRVEVDVVNGSDRPVYVCDKLVVSKPGGKFARTDAITVMNDDQPGVVKLALAPVSADEPSVVLYTPTFRAVKAGETFARVYELAYPLEAWHPVAGVRPVDRDAKSAVLLVQYIVGEPPGWRVLESDDARPLKVPEGHTPGLLRTEIEPLPTP